MAITVGKALLNNQSILEKITLVEEIDEQAAEIISGGKSVNLLNKEISASEEPDIIDPDEPGNDAEPPVKTANLAFSQDRSWRRSDKHRNHYC